MDELSFGDLTQWDPPQGEPEPQSQDELVHLFPTPLLISQYHFDYSKELEWIKNQSYKKQKTFNVGKVASSVGGSGAQAGSGTTAHIVASEAARNQFAIDSYTKKADYELENIREKGKNEQARFNNMADEVASQSKYLSRNRDMMVLESFFGGAVGGAGAGATFKSAWHKP